MKVNLSASLRQDSCMAYSWVMVSGSEAVASCMAYVYMSELEVSVKERCKGAS